MNNKLGTITTDATVSISLLEKRVSAFFAAFLGLALLFVAGFAETDILHNAAHDSRHSLITPCH